MSFGILNRSGHLVLLAAITAMNLATVAMAADAPAPTIERTGDWRAAVHRFAEANLKHPASGLSHSVRDYELAKELEAAEPRHSGRTDSRHETGKHAHDRAAAHRVEGRQSARAATRARARTVSSRPECRNGGSEVALASRLGGVHARASRRSSRMRRRLVIAHLVHARTQRQSAMSL